MKYEIVGARCMLRMAELVNERLQDGWTLHGSPFFADDYYHQAVVMKPETAHPEEEHSDPFGSFDPRD